MTDGAPPPVPTVVPKRIASARPAPLPDLTKPPRLSPQQARMLLAVSTHGDPLAHCRDRSDYGGAHGTLTSLHRLRLVEHTRRKGSRAKVRLALTELGRVALREHTSRTAADVAFTLTPPATRGREPQSPNRRTGERLVRRYLRAHSAETAARDFGPRERDLAAWIALELDKAGRR